MQQDETEWDEWRKLEMQEPRGSAWLSFQVAAEEVDRRRGGQ